MYCSAIYKTLYANSAIFKRRLKEHWHFQAVKLPEFSKTSITYRWSLTTVNVDISRKGLPGLSTTQIAVRPHPTSVQLHWTILSQRAISHVYMLKRCMKIYLQFPILQAPTKLSEIFSIQHKPKLKLNMHSKQTRWQRCAPPPNLNPTVTNYENIKRTHFEISILVWSKLAIISFQIGDIYAISYLIFLSIASFRQWDYNVNDKEW